MGEGDMDSGSPLYGVAAIVAAIVGATVGATVGAIVPAVAPDAPDDLVGIAVGGMCILFWPICLSHMAKAIFRFLASRGRTIGVFLIQSSYSGRPKSLI